MKNSPEVQAAYDEKRKLTHPKMTIRVPKRVKDDILEIAAEQGISFNSLVNSLLEEYIRTH